MRFSVNWRLAVFGLASLFLFAAAAPPAAAQSPLNGAEVSNGANGTNEGIAELVIWDMGQTSFAWDHAVWDDEVSDGFDSTWQDFYLYMDASGYCHWTVGDFACDEYGDPWDELVAIEAVAGVVGGDRQASVRGVTVEYYVNAVRAESHAIGIAAHPIATTMGQVGGSAQVTKWWGPESAGVNGVVIRGQVRLECITGALPSYNSIYARFVPWGF